MQDQRGNDMLPAIVLDFGFFRVQYFELVVAYQRPVGRGAEQDAAATAGEGVVLENIHDHPLLGSGLVADAVPMLLERASSPQSDANFIEPHPAVVGQRGGALAMLLRNTRWTMTVLVPSGSIRQGRRTRRLTPAESDRSSRHCPTPRPPATNTAQSPSRGLPSRSMVVVQGRVTTDSASTWAAAASNP